MPDKVSIKGTSDGLTITLGSGSWQTLLQEIEQKLSERASFFKGGRVSLSVGERLLEVAQLETLGQLLAQQQMTLWAVHGSASDTQSAAKSLGLETQTEQAAPAPTAKAEAAEPLSTKTVRGTLRSGQSVEYPGNVVIIGDVNPGARVMAGGHVIVWGKLRGTIHAGAMDPENAFVCALELSPMQLVIGQVISRSPSEQKQTEIIPEIAYVQDKKIIAEAWPK